MLGHAQVRPRARAAAKRQARPLGAAEPGARKNEKDSSDDRHARDLGDPVEPVALAEGEQPLGLGGEHPHGRLGLGLAVEDPVLVAAGAK